jgi:hypothetical protein
LLNGNGIPQIISLVKSSADEGLGYWRGISASGLFKPVNRIPRAGSHVGAFGAGLKPDGRPVVGWTAYDADWHVSAIYVAERNASGWSRPVELPAVGYLMGLAVDGIGATHVLAIRPDGALIYVTDRTGSWMTQVLYSGRVAEASLALGPDGSPHVVYTVGSPTSSAGVYYMKGAD